MIRYADSIEGVTAGMLDGFFDGWPQPPSPETHLAILQNSAFVLLAIDDDTGRVIGFINAISDGVLCAYIPLLEVLPDWRQQGIGKELTRRMLERLEGFYMVDLLCDEPVRPFYESAGMSPATAMRIRHYDKQSGIE
jgi:GNAT superfamily N-acetyltransferase